MPGSGVLWVALALASAMPSFADEPGASCLACHPRQVKGYRQTGMARSLRPAGHLPAGSFTHQRTGTRFTVESDAEGPLETATRGGPRLTSRAEWVIGSGNAAFGLLVRQGKALIQAPIAYYTRRAIWDLAPGFEQHAVPDYDRPVTEGCVWCHSGKPLPVEGTLNQYEPAAFADPGISCERCHGPSSAHLAKPGRGTIVNPARLPAVERDSVCEQCHLSGEARVLNPDRHFGGFVPGQKLEEVFSVYVAASPAADDGALKVISHVEQLALSRCRQKDGGRLWCGTCHDPHNAPAEPASFYRAKCLGCHEPKADQTHAAAESDCVWCHMPKRPVHDGGHSAFTDHSIARRPGKGTRPPETPLELKAWREPPGQWRQRNLGMAYAMVAEQERSLTHGAKAYALLAAEPDGDLEQQLAFARLLLARNRVADAQSRLARLAREYPARADVRVHWAAALQAAGQSEEAAAELRLAIGLDPSLLGAYTMLDGLYAAAGRAYLRRQLWERAVQAFPANLSVREAARALTLGQ